MYFIFVICNEINNVSRNMGAFGVVTTILELIMQLVSCYLDCSSINVIVYFILYRTCESEEDAKVYMGVTFGWSIAQFLHSHWGSKCLHVFKVWFVSSPSFIGCLLYRRMVCVVMDITRVHERVTTEFSSNGTAIQ